MKVSSPKLSKSSFARQRGQGMSEYIIIVALIAVAAIGVVGFMGDTITNQMATISQEIAGNDGSASQAAAAAAATAGAAEAATAKRMDNYHTSQ